MAEGTTIATAYVQIMPSMEGATSNITEAIMPQVDGAAATAGQSFGAIFGGKLSGVLSKVATPAAVITASIGASKALFDIGSEFDSMVDTIIVGTGASGEALDGLVASAQNIATTVPTSFAEAGDVVQNLNTRLGITGTQLEDLGARVLEAGNLLGEKMNLDTLTGALNTFGVSNEEAADKLDYLFNVGQATGISLNSLTGTLEKQAPALKALGFSFEESANMAGLLDKYGLDASATMGRMTKVLADAADKGIPARQAYEDIVGQLQHYLETGDEVKALQLADEVFGTRGSAQFLDAVKQGAISLDALEDSALGAGDGILGTMQRTEDLGEKMERLGNKIKVALEPLASGIFDIATNAMARLEQFVDDNQAVFTSLGNILGVVANIAGGVLGAALDVLMKGFGGVLTILQPVLAILEGLVNMLGAVFNKVMEIVAPIQEQFDALGAKAAEVFNGMSQVISQDMADAQQAAGLAADGLVAWLNGDFETAKANADAAFEIIRANISAKFEAAKNFVGSLADQIGQALGFPGLGDKVRGVFDAVGQFMQNPIQNALDFLGSVPGRIVDFFAGLGSRITSAIGSIHFPTPHISWETLEIAGMATPIKLPHVNWYAQGGIINAPSLIGVGESGAEAVVPLTNPALQPFADAVAEQLDRRGDTFVFNITADSETTLQRLVQEAQRARMQYA